MTQMTRRSWLVQMAQAMGAVSSLPLVLRAQNVGGQTNSASERIQRPAGFIDCHIHLTNTGFPGDPDFKSPDGLFPLAPFTPDEQGRRSVELVQSLETEMISAGIGTALCMPKSDTADDPLGINETLRLADLTKKVKLFAVGFANPERTDAKHISSVRKILQAGQVKALKAYLGYLHHYPSSDGYKPYYQLAKEFNIPVVFHTGDTSSPRAKLKYCHPLLIDEVAVDFPDVTFVIAHAGNPWILDAAEVASKNPNVWLDLSAILYGSAQWYTQPGGKLRFELDAERARLALEYAGGFSRSMFGSDWPGAPLGPARDFVRRIVRQQSWDKVFNTNAQQVYHL